MKTRLLWIASLGMEFCAAAGPPPPAELDTSSEQCRFCRMAVSDPRTAAQISIPAEPSVAYFGNGTSCEFELTREMLTVTCSSKGIRGIV